MTTQKPDDERCMGPCAGEGGYWDLESDDAPEETWVICDVCQGTGRAKEAPNERRCE